MRTVSRQEAQGSSGKGKAQTVLHETQIPGLLSTGRPSSYLTLRLFLSPGLLGTGSRQKVAGGTPGIHNPA